MLVHVTRFSSYFFFDHSLTTELYTLSLHDALPISWLFARRPRSGSAGGASRPAPRKRYFFTISSSSTSNTAGVRGRDRKSTRLNSSHQIISYAVFCLKKKKTQHSPDASSASI